jgi:hypothetical protein
VRIGGLLAVRPRGIRKTGPGFFFRRLTCKAWMAPAGFRRMQA